MLPLARNSKWSYSVHPTSECSNTIIPFMTSINHQEFLIAYESSNDILIFNVNNNEWTNMISNVIYSPRSQTLLFCPTSHKLVYIPISNRIEPLDLRLFSIKTQKQHRIKTLSNPLTAFCAVHTDDALHLIERKSPIFVTQHKHVIYSKNYQSKDEIEELGDHATSPMTAHLNYSTAIYVPLQRIILLIGGYDLWMEKLPGIWIYSELTKKWTKLPIEFNVYSMSAALTSDQKNIIIVGGLAKEGYLDSIYVLKVSEFWLGFILKKSLIKLPAEQRDPKIAITGGYKDQLLVTGYVKQTFATSEFNELLLPPVYIIQIMERYYNTETLHWMYTKRIENEIKRIHLTIPVRDILTNLQ